MAIPRLIVAALLLMLAAPVAFAGEKITVLSTSFVLERKFQLLEAAGRDQDVELAWVQVDKGGEEAVRRALAGARLVIVDAPRREDQASIEKVAGALLRDTGLPVANINVMSPPTRFRPVNLDGEVGERLFAYYIAGTKANRENFFKYAKAWLTGGDFAGVPAPLQLPNGGIYHAKADAGVIDNLPAYLDWWQASRGKSWRDRPVVAVEFSSSYISDGQTRMLDEMTMALEEAGAVPLLFYRSTRTARVATDRGAADARAVEGRGGRSDPRSGRPDAAASPSPLPAAPAAATTGGEESPWRQRRREREAAAAAAASQPNAFPNPKPLESVDVNEPLVTLDGKLLPQVLIVATFIGGDPEGRKAWHRAMGIPVIHLLSYRQGNRAAYAADNAGVNSFSLPFTLTQSEYIGMQDPVMLTTNEGGELVPMAEQMDLLVGKALNLARLQTTPNADKRISLLFWNHPPGEKNQSASNLNVPRSIELLVKNLRAEGYAFDEVSEAAIIEAVGQMLRPVYRKGGMRDLMQTPHWAFVSAEAYRSWYVRLPESVRQDVEKFWGAPEKSPWHVEHNGVRGFVVPRMKLGNLVVMPQPSRGEMATEEEEKKLFHDVKIPLSHSYMAAYLWIRSELGAHAIVHFGTHGTQEWTPGKERGMWAYDYPQILVGNVPVIYPYIVDNISEAIHVKRRGRGVIVSHQTPAFAPAGLSDDFVKINDLLREYQSLDEGLVKASNRRLLIEQARKMNIHKDLKWDAEKLEKDFDGLVRDLEDYLEDLGAAMQPLGLHTFGQGAEEDHLVSNVMQMLGQPLYEATGVKNARAAFRGDYRKLVESAPFKFVKEAVFADAATEVSDARLKGLAERGRKFRTDLKAGWETLGVANGLAGRWIDPSYGGDPIRNPDALNTGRNMYGFDPSRVPTKAAYDAGKVEIERLIETHRKTHGRAPQKLAFSVWSTETMRHLGMLEGQIMAAMGVRPKWDEGGRVVGMEVISSAELGRPRIDPVISITGLYRDQFPNVMERINEGLMLVAALDETDSDNPIRANSRRIEAALVTKGAAPALARNYALTRIFGNESGNYGTGLPDATLQSDKWDEKDGKLATGYLSRMSWGYGPDTGHWSEKLKDGQGREVNVYAEQLRGTDAAVFSRSSNLRGMLDTDHPFEYLGGLSLAIRHLDGASPQLYISNMRDPQRAKLETAERFMANELRAVYQHPRWIKEMQKEGYAGTLKMLDVINNFWGWQAMDRNVVRDDQWQEFHESYVKDRYQLGMRERFDKSNPTALAQIAERMLEAIRKDYWKTDETTKRELVEIYRELAEKHDVVSSNQTFNAYVAELAQGFGLQQPSSAAPTNVALKTPAAPPPPQQQQPAPEQPAEPTEVVRGQQLSEVKPPAPLPDMAWLYIALNLVLVAAGMAWQALQPGRHPSTAPHALETP